MVGCLAARIEEQITRDAVGSAKVVVQVDESSRSIEEDVGFDRGLAGHRLEDRRCLLLQTANLAYDVAYDPCASRLLASRTVDAHAGGKEHAATADALRRAAPQRDCAFTCAANKRGGAGSGAKHQRPR